MTSHPFDTLLTPERAAKYRAVLAQRTPRLTVVIEDCHDPHNATAIVRTCDAFGIQNVHVTTSRNTFKINRRISQGSHFYIDLHVHRSIEDCYAALRAQGYRIWVSDLQASATVGPQRLREDLENKPIALIFGSEQSGVSPLSVSGADGCFLIPMVGFPQSLNVSVSVAVTLYALRGDRLAAGTAGDFTAVEQNALYERWVEGRRGEAVTRLLRAGHSHKGEDLDVFDATPTS